MSEPIQLIYWDSCALLSYINGIQDRLPHLEALLQNSGRTNAKSNPFQLVTSTTTIVEVAFGKVEQDGTLLDGRH